MCISVLEQHSVKSYSYAVAEVLLSSSGIATADIKKRYACPPQPKDNERRGERDIWGRETERGGETEKEIMVINEKR
jgi:hypothetical protein